MVSVFASGLSRPFGIAFYPLGPQAVICLCRQYGLGRSPRLQGRRYQGGEVRPRLSSRASPAAASRSAAVATGPATWNSRRTARSSSCPSVPGPTARLPQGPVRDVLTAMARTWGELDDLEQRHGLSFLREPDGFVGAAYRWARGAKLEDVLDSVPGLTPGELLVLFHEAAHRPARPGRGRLPSGTAPSRRDAARAGGTRPDPEPGGTSQATRTRATGRRANGRPAGPGAPKDRDVAATARAAIAAMRRGVIAYSGLAD